MKYSIKHLLSASLLFSAYAFGSQAMDSMHSQLAAGPDLDLQGKPVISTGNSGYTLPLEGVPAWAKTPAQRAAAVANQATGRSTAAVLANEAMAEQQARSAKLGSALLGGGLEFVPASLKQYVTPAMAKDSAFISFLNKQHAFWTAKMAMLDKYPELKAKMKEHLQLKQDMLKFKEKSPEYKKFFEEQFKYWINQAATELK